MENYTACFSTAMDGQVHAKQLRRCRGRYPRLYVLNGLAGEGITRGPGAGLHIARLIGEARTLILTLTLTLTLTPTLTPNP